MIEDDFAGMFNNISLTDLDDILEFLEDNNFLNEKGKKFRHDFWKKYSSVEYKEEELSQEEISELEKVINKMIKREKNLKSSYCLLKGMFGSISSNSYLGMILKFVLNLLKEVIDDEEILSD